MPLEGTVKKLESRYVIPQNNDVTLYIVLNFCDTEGSAIFNLHCLEAPGSIASWPPTCK